MWWMLIVPIVSVIILWKLFPDTMQPWEYFTPILASVLAIWIAGFTCDYFMAWDYERHGGWVTASQWDEEWTETYTDIETYTDSNGKTQTRTVVKTRYHPDEYHCQDSNGYEVTIDKDHYINMRSVFGNEVTEKPWRSGQSSWGDGRRFTTKWTGNDGNFTPCFTMHRYENRVARSNSVMNLPSVSKADRLKYGIYEYPEMFDYHFQNSILGWNDSIAEKLLMFANARLGKIQQVQVFILVFKNQPLQTGVLQKNHWKNGNKNEVVTCIGIDNDNKIDWVYPFCWDNENLKVNIREEIASMDKLEMIDVVNKVIQLVGEKFHRKSFKEFEYIKLDPPLWAKTLVFFFILLVNGGVATYVVANDFN